MKKTTLKKLMVIGIGTMALLGSSISVSAEDCDHTGGTEIRDAKPALCTEDGYTGDTYCSGCFTKIASGTTIPALGHYENRNHRCERKTKIYDSNGEMIQEFMCHVITDCQGGTATCKDKAICEICTNPYGEVDSTNHVGDTEIRNAKSATCTEDGYTGDTYCKDCNAKIMDGEPIAKLGHIDDNKDHYCDREKCGQRISYCSGGTATCKEKAVCDYCGKPYGELNGSNHAGGTYIRNAKAATCNEDGYTGDTYCRGCETKLQNGHPVTKLGHIDADKNHVCDREDCKSTLSNCDGGTATCIDQAICDYCGDVYGSRNINNHAGGTEIRDAKEATCIEEGYTGDTYCGGCFTKIKSGTSIPVDPDNHGYGMDGSKMMLPSCEGDFECMPCNDCKNINIIYRYEAEGHDDKDKDHYCDNVNVICHNNSVDQLERVVCGYKMSNCQGGTATCNTKAVCDYCGNEYGEVDSTNHVGGTEIRDAKPVTCTEDGYTGDTYCLGCTAKIMDGEPIAKLGHIDDNKDHVCDREDCNAKLSDHTGGTATCKDLAICEYCSNEYGGVDSTNHVGDTEIRDAKPATCTEDGYTGDTYCTSCNTKLLDGTIIPATGHIDSDNNNECDACNIIINETEAETEPITEKEKPAKKKETEKQTESIKPVVEEPESNNLPEAPKTGDNTPIVVMVSLLLGSIAIIFACITCRSRKED